MRLERLLGSGSSAQVFAASHPETGRRVAAKLLYAVSVTKLGSLTAEVHLAMSLNHDCVCKTYGTAVAVEGAGEQPCPVLVMELVEGGTLEDLIHQPRQAPYSPGNAARLPLLPLKARLAWELAEGVAYLHSHRVVHCDLKPANVLLTHGDTPHVKLSDFGVATRLAIAQREEKFGVFGTPRYMAPEVAFRAFSFPADVYSYGVILYELLHERRFLGNERCSTALDILLYVLSARPHAQLHPTMLEGADEAERSFAALAAGLIEDCWGQSWEARPPMEEVARRLAAAARRAATGAAPSAAAHAPE